jgi:hypothetical protein
MLMDAAGCPLCFRKSFPLDAGPQYEEDGGFPKTSVFGRQALLVRLPWIYMKKLAGIKSG